MNPLCQTIHPNVMLALYAVLKNSTATLVILTNFRITISFELSCIMPHYHPGMKIKGAFHVKFENIVKYHC